MQSNPSADARIRVLVIGGGVAGLTVAHELQRIGGFDIRVIDKQATFGGKARTTPVDAAFREHSMRVLPGSYVCMHQVMKEIPVGGGTAYDHLRPAEIEFRSTAGSCVVGGNYTGSLTDRLNFLKAAWKLLRFLRRSGVSFLELVVFVFKIFSLVVSPERKVTKDISRLKFSEYLGEPPKGSGLERIVFRVAEILVAAKSYASAAVVSRTLLEWFITPFLKGDQVRKVVSELDGPTSAVLIDPWVQKLGDAGVDFQAKTEATELCINAGRVSGLRVRTPEGEDELKADVYIVALQHNIADALFHKSAPNEHRLRQLIPGLVDFPHLGEEWAHSVQFTVSPLSGSLERLGSKSVAVVESPWSIGYKVYSRATWPGLDWDAANLPEDHAIVTATISNSNRPGINHKSLLQCTEREVLDEVLAQTGLGSELKVEQGRIGLDLQHMTEAQFNEKAATFDGHAVARTGVSETDGVYVTDAQMYIRLPGNLDVEPDNRTGVFNLFLAGEYTRTNYRIPTMEKSCESGKRCAIDVAARVAPEHDLRSRLPECHLPFRWLRSEVLHSVIWYVFLVIALISILRLWSIWLRG